MRSKGEHRVRRGLLVSIGIAATAYLGALLFERPAQERVDAAFRRAAAVFAPTDLVIVEAGPLTYRTIRSGRFHQRERRKAVTTLWCAHDRARPELAMAIEYHNSSLPLASGPRTVARSWVRGRRLRADELLLECKRQGA